MINFDDFEYEPYIEIKTREIIKTIVDTWYNPQMSQETHTKAEMGILRNQELLRELLIHLLKRTDRKKHENIIRWSRNS